MSDKKDETKYDLDAFDQGVEDYTKYNLDAFDKAVEKPNSKFLDILKNTKDYALQKGAEQGQNAYAALAGYTRNFVPFSDELGGLTQSILQAAQSGAHNIAPSVVPESEKQMAEKLKEQGFTGDIGPETYGKVYQKGTEEQEKDFEKLKKENPASYYTGATGGVLGQGAVVGGATGSLLSKIAPGLKPINLKAAYNLGKIESGTGTAIKNVAQELGKTALTEAPVGALFGAEQSKSKVIGSEEPTQELQKLGKDVAAGAATGAVLGPIFKAAGEEVIQPTISKVSDVLKNLKENFNSIDYLTRAFKRGIEGKTYWGNKQTTADVEKFRSGIEDLNLRIQNGIEEHGQMISKGLKEDTKNGFKVHFDNEDSKLLSGIIESDQGGQKIAAKLTSNEPLTPDEAYRMKKYFDQLASLEKDPQKQIILSNIRKKVGQQIKDQLPSFARANDNYSKFLDDVVEPIINEGLNPEVAKTSASEVQDVGRKVYENLSDIGKNIGKLGDASSEARNTLNRITQASEKGYARENPELIEKLNLKPEDIQSQMTELGKEYGASRAANIHEPRAGLLNKASLAGTSLGMAGANVAGRITNLANKAGQNISQNVYKMTDSLLMNHVNNLKAKFPTLENSINALEKALNERDQFMRDASLYSLMQNPAVREYFYSSEPSSVDSE